MKLSVGFRLLMAPHFLQEAGFDPRGDSFSQKFCNDLLYSCTRLQGGVNATEVCVNPLVIRGKKRFIFLGLYFFSSANGQYCIPQKNHKYWMSLSIFQYSAWDARSGAPFCLTLHIKLAFTSNHQSSHSLSLTMFVLLHGLWI